MTTRRTGRPPGRPPTPVALRLLSGNPGHRPVPPAPPPLPPAVATVELEPPPPVANDATALATWRRLAPILRPLGLLGPLEVDAFSAYCKAVSRWTLAEERLAAEGHVMAGTDSRRPMVSPWATISDRAVAQLESLGVALGLPASARARLLGAGPLAASWVPPAEAAAVAGQRFEF